MEVIPKPGNTIFDGAPGAFTNALCLCIDKDHYCRLVEEMFPTMDLEVKEITDVETLEDRRGRDRPRHDVDKEVIKLAESLSDTQPAVYDTFYVYEAGSS